MRRRVLNSTNCSKRFHAPGKTFESWLGSSTLGERLLAAVRDWTPSGTGIARNVGGVAAAIAGAIVNLLLVVVAGIYLAAQPRIYRSGLLNLIPPKSRAAGRDAMAAAERGLRSWLGAQLIGMIAIGALTTLGLWIIGVPSALALGLLAGLAEFVPIVGPIFAPVRAAWRAVRDTFGRGDFRTGARALREAHAGRRAPPAIERKD